VIGACAGRGVTGIWEAVVRDRDGKVKHRGAPHANVRTQGGSDWQAQFMQGAVTNNVAQRAATSVATTTLNDTGAAFPTVNNISNLTAASGGLIGQILAVGPNASGVGSTVYGVIISNTATAITVDRWVAAGSPFAAGTTPNGTAQYQVIPVPGPGWFLGISTTVNAGTATDSALGGELTGLGLARKNATTITHTLASATYTLAVTWTSSDGTSRTINSEGVFNGSGTAGVTNVLGGVLCFENAEPNPPTLVSGDQLTNTITVNY
jgi:hypothetical protein